MKLKPLAAAATAMPRGMGSDTENSTTRLNARVGAQTLSPMCFGPVRPVTVLSTPVHSLRHSDEDLLRLEAIRRNHERGMLPDLEQIDFLFQVLGRYNL